MNNKEIEIAIHLQEACLISYHVFENLEKLSMLPALAASYAVV